MGCHNRQRKCYFSPPLSRHRWQCLIRSSRGSSNHLQSGPRYRVLQPIHHPHLATLRRRSPFLIRSPMDLVCTHQRHLRPGHLLVRPSSALPGHRLQYLQPPSLRPTCSHSCGIHRPHLPHHYRLLQFQLLRSDTPHLPHLLCHHWYRPLLPTIDTLALPRQPLHLLLPLAMLQPHIPLLPHPIHSPPSKRPINLAQNRRRQQRQPVRSRHMAALLVPQLHRHDSSRPRMRECSHGHRTAMDSALAHILGHYERGNRLLCIGVGA